MKRDALPDAVLQVRALSKRFTMHLRGARELPVLGGVSLDVAPGECIALTGPSGRGKSTLMKCLYGSYGIDSGHVWLHDGASSIDLASASAQDILALRRRTVSYVSQFLRVVPRVSALDVVAQRVVEAEPAMLDDASYAHVLARSQDAARTLLARLNLPPALWDLPPATFSGGEQQRVNIARGFIVPSRLLLLDEPTASLDRANSDVVVSLIHEAKASGTAVVGIFHDPAIRDAVATRTIAFE